MSPPATNVLDHLVHLSPPGTLEEITRSFTELGFTVIPGGTHADGLTENALVLFSDQNYIELISFTHPPSHYPPGSPQRHDRITHPWANKQRGWIDFAFLGNDGEPSIAGVINRRAEADGSGVKYESEVRGGRVRPDGKELEWLISAPTSPNDGEDVRGRWPFFCGDLTPRELRVPLSPENTTHANTARGVGYLRLLAPRETIADVAGQISTVVGYKPDAVDLPRGTYTWKLKSMDGLGEQVEGASIVLDVPRNQKEEEYVEERGTGLYEVGVRVRSGIQRDVVAGETAYGRIVLSHQ